MNCSVDGCCKPSARSGFCWTHLKRKQRQKDVTTPVREYGKSPTWRVSQAALRYANADPLDDAEFSRARDILLKYAKAYGRQLQRKLSTPKSRL